MRKARIVPSAAPPGDWCAEPLNQRFDLSAVVFFQVGADVGYWLRSSSNSAAAR